MDFFDKLADASRDAAETVAKAAGDLVDKGKAEYNLLQAQGDQKSLLRAYGALCYKEAKGEAVSDGEKAELIAKLDDIAARIAELQAAKAAAADPADKKPADAQVCPVCGAERVNNSPFCGQCGAKF